MANRMTAVLGGGLLAGAVLLGQNAAGAQTETPTCRGVEATIVITDLPAPDQALLEGTEGDDVMWVDIPEESRREVAVSVHGLGGNDIICTSGVTAILGGDGDDILQVIDGGGLLKLGVEGGEGNDTIYGGDGPNDYNAEGRYWEFLVGDAGDDIIFGGDGFDFMYGLDGNDTLYGNAGNDIIVGGGGSDTMYGGWGIDTIYGGDDWTAEQEVGLSTTPDEADTIYGGPGTDGIIGGLGADQIYGGPGDDILVSNDMQDIGDLDGTTPPDLLDTAGARMFGGTGNDVIVGSNRWDRMQGGPGDDTLFGFEGRDYIRGGPGDDIISGGLGIDDVNGNTGADQLIVIGGDTGRGGFGRDTCLSGPNSAGADVGSCERSASLDGPVGQQAIVRAHRDWLSVTYGRAPSRLRVGECIAYVDENFSSFGRTFGCGVPHRYEIYRQLNVSDEFTDFDEAALATYAFDACGTSLAAYIPDLNDGRNIQYSFLLPTAADWNNPLDPNHIVTCVLFDGDGGDMVGRAA